MPELMDSDPKLPAVKPPNIFDRLVTGWDKKTLRRAMVNSVESIPHTIPLTFRFIDHVRHYHCRVFKSNGRFFIGGWQVELRHLHLENAPQRAIENI